MKITAPRLFSITLLVLTANAVGAEQGNLQTFQQQFQQQAKQNLNDVQYAQQQRWLAKQHYQSTEKTEQSLEFSTDCLPYSGIQIVGVTLLDPKPLLARFSAQSGACLNEAGLNQLSRELTAAYLAKGYIHNPFQFEDDQSGILTLRVIEGKVRKLSSQNERLNLAMLFPNMIGQPLQVHQLDQGLDQANKMAGSQVSVDVLPAPNGDIELVFVNEQANRVTGVVGVDNYGAKITDRWQARVGLNIDSPFGLSDTLSIALSHSLKHYREPVSRSATVVYSVPYGRWSWTAFLAFSQFRQQTPLTYTQVEQKGRSWQGGLKGDYVFHRGSNHISSAYLGLERLEVQSRFAGDILALQSPKLTTLQAGLTHLQLWENGSLFADLNYEKGLKWWHASPNQGGDQPQGQFSRLGAELQLQQYHFWGSQIFQQSHRLFGQYSNHYLFGLKQADLVGRYAVRGVNDLGFSAEKNLIVQNTFVWKTALKQVQLEPYLFVDGGWQKTSSLNAHSQKAVGYGLGIKGQWAKWAVNLEWGTGRIFLGKGKIAQERSLHASLNWRF